MTREEQIDKIVLCDTLRRAFYWFNELAYKYPDLWIKKSREPMSLTSTYGVRYIFRSKTEFDKIRGARADIISIDKVYEEIGEVIK